MSSIPGAPDGADGWKPQAETQGGCWESSTPHGLLSMGWVKWPGDESTPITYNTLWFYDTILLGNRTCIYQFFWCSHWYNGFELRSRFQVSGQIIVKRKVKLDPLEQWNKDFGTPGVRSWNVLKKEPRRVFTAILGSRLGDDLGFQSWREAGAGPRTGAEMGFWRD